MELSLTKNLEKRVSKSCGMKTKVGSGIKRKRKEEVMEERNRVGDRKRKV